MSAASWYLVVLGLGIIIFSYFVGVKVISNAGGINPEGCVEALKKAAEAAGVSLNIACVTGDNLMLNKEEIVKDQYKDMNTNQPLPPQVHSMNAYIG